MRSKTKSKSMPLVVTRLDDTDRKTGTVAVGKPVAETAPATLDVVGPPPKTDVHIQHPIGERVSLCADNDTLAVIANSIMEQGVIEPVTTYEGRILAGWKVYQECQRQGVDCPSVRFEDSDQFKTAKNKAEQDRRALEFALFKNFARTHASTSQRALVAADLARRPEGRPKLRSSAEFVPSAKQAAKLCGVSPRLVEDAKHVLRHGTQAEIESVKKDEIAVSLLSAEIAKRERHKKHPELRAQNDARLCGKSKSKVEPVDDERKPNPDTTDTSADADPSPKLTPTLRRNQFLAGGILKNLRTIPDRSAPLTIAALPPYPKDNTKLREERDEIERQISRLQVGSVFLITHDHDEAANVFYDRVLNCTLSRDIILHKTKAATPSSHAYVFQCGNGAFDAEALPPEYRGSIWPIPDDGSIIPAALAKIIILACSKPGDVVLHLWGDKDSVVAKVAKELGRDFIVIQDTPTKK